MKGEYWERALLARRAFLRFLLLLLVFIGFYLTIFVEYGILKMIQLGRSADRDQRDANYL